MTTEGALHLYMEGSLEPGTVRPTGEPGQDANSRKPPRKSKPDNKPTLELEPYLKDIAQKFETGARPGKFARYRVWTENELFWRGQQLLTFNSNYGKWMSWDEDDQDLYFIDNVLFPFIEQNCTEYSKSRPRLSVYSTKGDDRKTTAAVEQAQYISDCLIDNLWTPEDLQREAHIVQFRSCVFTRTYFDARDDSEVEERPVFQERSVSLGPDLYECRACGGIQRGDAEVRRGTQRREETGGNGDVGTDEMGTRRRGETGTPGDPAASPSLPLPVSPPHPLSVSLPPRVSASPSCPECGSGNLMLHQAPQVQLHSFAGTEKCPAGRVRSDAVDPMQVEIWDRAYTVEDSPYLRWERIELIAAVRDEYPDAEFNPDNTDYGGVYGQTGLSFLRQLEVALGNSGAADANYGYGASFGYGYGAGAQLTDEMTCRHTRVYFDKVVYQDYEFRKDETIPGTDLLVRKGTRLADVFDQGLKICFVNGQIVGCYNVSKNDEWSCYKYTVSGAGFYGVGTENLLPLQKWHNETVSYDLSEALYQSAGVTLVDTTRIKDGNLANKPGTIVPVEDRVPGESLDDIIKHVTTEGSGEKLAAMRMALKEDMQMVSGARSSAVSGLPGPSLGTATGVMYQQSTADSFAGTKLELRAWNLARRMEQALKLIQINQLIPRYYTRFGETKGKWLSGLDIPGELRVRVEADTHSPRTQLDVKTDSVQAIQLGWGNPQTPPMVARQIGRIFHMPADQNAYDEWSVRGQKRLDDMQLAAELMRERGVPPEAAAPFVIQQAAPNMKLDNHQNFIAFYSDWYLSDEYEQSDPVVQQAIEGVIELHEQAMAALAQQQIARQQSAMGAATN
ncbi:MAG TPA: hypothetical protein VN345_20265 [Blastocatellia bacterium]|nr:hypothetical protein [Blastocatellia bacterium]